MTRRFLIVACVVLASTSGLAMLLGVGWVVLHLVSGVFPDILAARLRVQGAVLPALFLLVAFVAGGCAAAMVGPADDDRSHSGHGFSGHPGTHY